MEDSQIARVRGKPRETVKKDIEINELGIWFLIEHYGII